ncbi:hypothetical protein SY88_18375 [Clostridiales bacterium PH28_bin88]|nr:hypothetical protein SY88_18375 [Clostridiales bacterium PH28_bin88]
MSRLPQYLLPVFLLGVGAALITAAYREEADKEWKTWRKAPVAVNLPAGETERCLTCHEGIEPISDAHPVEVIGCVSCHGGNGLALDKERAHAGLKGGRNPGDLSVAREACGGNGINCHVGRESFYRSPVDTVPLVPMATKAGEIAMSARDLGWQPDGLSRYGVRPVPSPGEEQRGSGVERGLADPASGLQAYSAGDQPAEKKLADNCLADCHLWAGLPDKEQVSPQKRGDGRFLGGCSACHVPFRPGGVYEGEDRTVDRTAAGHAPRHEFTTAIPYTACNACHNQGVHSLARMEFLQRDDIPPGAITDPRADRQAAYYIPLARYAGCEVTLDCIDCHTRNEVMGDGHLYGNKEKAQVIRCYNCHGTAAQGPRWQRIESADADAIWAVRAMTTEFPELEQGDVVAMTDKGEPMINVRLEAGQPVLYSKIDGRRIIIPQVAGSACTQDTERQRGDDCHNCHDVSG